MKTLPPPAPRFAARLIPAATAMVWCGPGRPHEPMAVLHARLAPGDALVEIELATVCERDVQIARGEGGASGPLVPGHEAVGRVITAGAEAVDVECSPLRPGDRVIWSVWMPCGSCPECRAGAAGCAHPRAYGREPLHAGWELSGAFATHIQLRAGTAIVKVGETAPAEVLSRLACQIATEKMLIPGAAYAVELRASARSVEHAWRRAPSSAASPALALSRLDDALERAESGASVAVEPG